MITMYCPYSSCAAILQPEVELHSNKHVAYACTRSGSPHNVIHSASYMRAWAGSCRLLGCGRVRLRSIKSFLPPFYPQRHAREETYQALRVLSCNRNGARAWERGYLVPVQSNRNRQNFTRFICSGSGRGDDNGSLWEEHVHGLERWSSIAQHDCAGDPLSCHPASYSDTDDDRG